MINPLPASITKNDLRRLGPQYGCVNKKQWSGFAPGTVRYVTFIGVMDHATRLLVGAHHFEACTPNASAVQADFNKLFAEEIPCP